MLGGTRHQTVSITKVTDYFMIANFNGTITTTPISYLLVMTFIVIMTRTFFHISGLTPKGNTSGCLVSKLFILRKLTYDYTVTDISNSYDAGGGERWYKGDVIFALVAYLVFHLIA